MEQNQDVEKASEAVEPFQPEVAVPDALLPPPPPPRTLTQINLEYTQYASRMGDALFKMDFLAAESHLIKQQMNKLNLEAQSLCGQSASALNIVTK